ncbi:beta-ketoacyl synthase chain length factor [Acinetobacter sp. HY1485]|uniref:beta-ketoacyl synthase chain length factor n=1 Tax=Acinetobacter sp. HY1485 TaxID=2970918 RepID=UPI0022B983B3|nr:beta-ketoacyl synthase chain length factor [Acinetobacter sp. HY1485]
MELQLHIEQLFKSVASSEFEALKAIPPMQRRRLSPLAKLALNSALNVLQYHQVDYIVWASQFGDEEKTLNILKDILQGELPSPTQFSTSVHNAIAGLYSILKKDDTISTSLSATWSEAIVDAYAFLKTHSAKKALVVYYDFPIPNVYTDLMSFEAFSLAGIVSLDQPNLILNLNQVAMLKRERDAIDFENFWSNPELKHSQQGVWQR